MSDPNFTSALQSALDESLGPLLLEMAKQIHEIRDLSIQTRQMIGQGIQRVPVVTPVASDDSSDPLDDLSNSLNQALSDLGASPLTDDQPSADFETSFVPSEPSTAGASFAQIDPEIIRNIVQSELESISIVISEQFEKIDKTLGRFFQKSVTDSKEVQALINEIPETIGLKLTEQLSKIKIPAPAASQPSTRPSFTQTSSASPTPTQSTPSPSYTSPALQQDDTGGKNDAALIMKDLEELYEFFEGKEIGPKDASTKVERARDDIFNRELPNRGFFARAFREILSIAKQEMSFKEISDEAKEEIKKQVEDLKGRVY